VSGIERPPILESRVAAAAMTGSAPFGSSDGRVRAFAATLSPLGRLAVVRPGPESEEEVRNAGLRVVSVDPRVVLAAAEA
jgi:hypothetical protein